MRVKQTPPDHNTINITNNITTPPNQSPVAPPTSQDVAKLQEQRPAPPAQTAQGISQAQPT